MYEINIEKFIVVRNFVGILRSLLRQNKWESATFVFYGEIHCILNFKNFNDKNYQHQTRRNSEQFNPFCRFWIKHCSNGFNDCSFFFFWYGIGNCRSIYFRSRTHIFVSVFHLVPFGTANPHKILSK